jgi:1-acyl-sn-glycerol-3-phosphate acyltransferase
MSPERPSSIGYEAPRPYVFKAMRRLVKVVPVLGLRGIELTFEGSENVPIRGGASIASNHRHDDYDVLAAGYAISERRAPFYPAKNELNKGAKGWVLEGCGALFFDRDDPIDRKRIYEDCDSHVGDEHAVLTFVEGTSKNQGRELGPTFDSATRIAVNHELDEVILVGIGGTDTPFRTDPEGLAKKKREKPEKIHVEISSVSLAAELRDYRLAEKSVPIPIKKAIHNEIVIPSLQEVVDVAYEKAT